MKEKTACFKQVFLNNETFARHFYIRRGRKCDGLVMESEVRQDISGRFLSKGIPQTLAVVCSGLSDLVCFDFYSILSSLSRAPPPSSLSISHSILPSGFCSLLGNETLPHNGYTVRNTFEYTFRKHNLCHAAMMPNSNCLD